MFEAMSPEKIRQDILDRIRTDQDKREGSQLSDEVAAVALAISNVYHQLDALVPSFYLDENSGPYIEQQAAMVGIRRKPGTKAVCQLVITGRPGSVIPVGTQFYTASNLAFALVDEPTVPESGTGSGWLMAVEEGAAGNIGKGEIVSTIHNYPGIESYHNGPAHWGTDPESDRALLDRYFAHLRKPATSGNAYHYEHWATEVAGVGACRVFGLHAGPGTVKLVVADSNLLPPSEETVNAVRNHVAGEMPIGPTLTVTGATGLTINVTAKPVLRDGVSLEKVTADFRAALTSQLAEEARKGFQGHVNCAMEEIQGYTLSWAWVGYLLLTIDGVADFTGLAVNGGTDNIRLGAEQVPVLGTVTLT